MKLTHSSVYIT